MKRKRKGLIVLAIVAMVAILGIGYAAITNVGLVQVLKVINQHLMFISQL